MSSFLVTGAQGFTGRYLVAELLGADPSARVVGIGRSPASATTFSHVVSLAGRAVAAPLPTALLATDRRRYDYLSCDLADGDSVASVLEHVQPNVVIHLAAALRDDPPPVLLHSNIDGTRALLDELARLKEPPLVILASSGSVYGNAPVPFTEDGTYAPVDPYAQSKLAAELIAKLIARDAGVPLIVARIFNIVGPGMDERHVCARFAQQAVAIASGRCAPSIEVGNLKPSRDFIDVTDVARALIGLVRHGSPGSAYNVASGIETTIADVLDIILREAGILGQASIVERYVRRDDLIRQQADVSRMRAHGIYPTIGIAESLRALVAYYRDDVTRALDALH